MTGRFSSGRIAAGAVASVALVLGSALVAVTPAHAADFLDVDTEAELNDAIQYAIDNPTDPVAIDISGDISIATGITQLTAGSVTVAGNGHTITATSVSAAGFRALNDSILTIDALTFDFYESGPVVKAVGTPADPGLSPTVTVSGVIATAGAFDVAFEVEDTTFSMSATTIHDSDEGFVGDFSFGAPSISGVTILDAANCGISVVLSGDASLTMDRITIERSGCQALWVNAGDTSTATITNAMLQDNASGMVLFNQGSGTIEVLDSTIAGSTTAEQMFVVTQGGDFRMSNSTVSGSVDTGYSIVSVMFDDADIVVEHSTLTGNAVSAAPVLAISDCGCASSGSFELSHSIVAGNPGAGALAPDVFLDLDPSLPRSIDYSLIGAVDPADTTTLDAIAAGTGNLFDATTPIDPDLGPLAPNGGWTSTHLPNATSPVINAGDPAFVAPPATDQRGEARVSAAIIDIGSVEVQFTPSLVLSRSTSAVGEQVTVTGAGFPAGTMLTMVLNSTPITLGTATSTPTGALSFAFTVPTGVPAGAHTVTASLLGTVLASAAITVTGLPDTGADQTPTMLAGIALLLLGGAALAVRRRQA